MRMKTKNYEYSDNYKLKLKEKIMTREEIQKKIASYTEKDFFNPTPEMLDDLCFLFAYSDWETYQENRKRFKSKDISENEDGK